NPSHFRALFFFFSSRRRHTRFSRDWSSDVCSSDLRHFEHEPVEHIAGPRHAQEIASNAEDAEFPDPLGPYLRPRLGRGWSLLVTGLPCPGRHARPLTPAPRGKATFPAAPAPSTVHSPLTGQVRHVTLRTSRSRSRLPARHRA